MNSTNVRGFSRAERLLSAADYARMKSSREKVHGRMLTYVRKTNIEDRARLGLIVTRKTGNAVVRNRWKRVLREFFRAHKSRFASHGDHLWIVKPSTKGKPPAYIEKELTFLLDKIK